MPAATLPQNEQTLLIAKAQHDDKTNLPFPFSEMGARLGIER